MLSISMSSCYLLRFEIGLTNSTKFSKKPTIQIAETHLFSYIYPVNQLFLLFFFSDLYITGLFCIFANKLTISDFMPNYHILSDTNRLTWIKDICSIRREYENCSGIESVTLLLPENIERNELHPMHIVSLACLLEYLNSRCKRLKVIVQNNNTLDFLVKDLKLGAYFSGLPHTEAESTNLLNLWKIIPEEAQSYSHGLSSFFEQNLFKGFDISFFNVAIDELYGNVADHSNAGGVAYSYIEYDEP